MKLKHLFIPHPQTHVKAHLISIKGIVFYIVLFIALNVSFNILSVVKPGVLGISSQVNQQELIDLTNKEREKVRLEPLKESLMLNKAALEKGKNMFEEGYWAHYSPSGKDPWGFINNTGYKFTYAGENLAKNFYSSDDVVKAWMASRTHKENILNIHYKEIGIAILEGVLNGQKTVLIVQEFGTPIEFIAENPFNENNQTTSVGIANSNIQNPQQLGQSTSELFIASENISRNTIDQYLINKNLGLVVILLISSLLIVDFFVLRYRRVTRITSAYLPHLAFLAVAASTMLNTTPGTIL